MLGPLWKLARSIPGSCVLVMLLNSWLEHLLRALWVIEKYTLCTFLLFACWLMCMGADRLLFNLTSVHLACSFNRMIKCQDVFLGGTEGLFGHNECIILEVEEMFTVGWLG